MSEAILVAGKLGAALQGNRAGDLVYKIRAAGGRLAFPAEDVMTDLAGLVVELLVEESRCEHQRRQYGSDAQVDFVAVMSAHPLAVLAADKHSAVCENRKSGTGGVQTMADDGGHRDVVSIVLAM